MILYFLRHGLADWPNWDRPDSERPLTDEGIEKMKVEAKAIAKLGLELDAIVSSPYARAKQTAAPVARRLKVDVIEDEALAPGFDIDRLRAVLARYPARKAVMLVGHEPDFSRTIAQLTGGRVMMKKGGLARVDLDALDPQAGRLVWLLTPRTLLA